MLITVICFPFILQGYATSLRSLTSGRATCSLEFSNYEIMNATEQTKAIQKITGFF